MPIYAEVEGIGKLEFPDGTDPSVIQATVKRVVQSRQQQASESKTDVMGGVKDSWLGGMVRGIRDPIDAGRVPEDAPLLGGDRNIGRFHVRASCAFGAAGGSMPLGRFRER